MKTGETISWAVVDPETREIMCYCASRERARDIASHSGCRIARVVVAK
jgi:hypothetical protein